MRSAIIGVVHCEDADLRRQFTKASSVLTHSDPRAEYGARAVADLAAFVTRTGSRPTGEELERILGEAGDGREWSQTVRRTIEACESGVIEDALTPAGLKQGVSGFVLHTLPVAVAAWYLHFGDFRRTIETVARLGGDTDTVAAIAGSLAGVTCTKEGIPDDWLSAMIDRPHSLDYLSRLADTLNGGRGGNTGFSWLLLPRGFFFTAVVLSHGFRRLLPPY